MKPILLLSYSSPQAHSQLTPETIIARFFKDFASNPGPALQNIALTGVN
jgi:hypothetical protein